MDSGQEAVDMGQWAITEGIGQWTVKFGLAIFSSFTKYSLHFVSKYSLEAKICFQSNLFCLLNLLTHFDAKQTHKTILFASKQINIRFMFAYICFQPNMSGAFYLRGVEQPLVLCRPLSQSQLTPI